MKTGWIALALGLLSGAANAQVTFTTNAPPPTSFADPILRVTSSFRTTVQPAEGQNVPDAKGQEAARRELYRLTENECAVLMDIYKADCHLTGLIVTVPVSAPNAQTSNTMVANAVFELRMRNAK